MDNDKYISPLSTRYASSAMQNIFSTNYKFTTWRKLWVALAKAQKQLGLHITDEQISQMQSFSQEINYKEAEVQEQKVRHDVMAHVYAFGIQCPKAAPIIHLGATSCYVVDNTDLIIMRKALKIIKGKAIQVIKNLASFADNYKNMPTLGFTHFQPAQLTTVGKRACLWIYDLVLDIEEINFVLNNLKFLGSKGTTGTQASFLQLFENDSAKVTQLEQIIAKEFDFDEVYSVSGQTYSRKIDSRIVNTLAQVAQSSIKFSNDLRLLAHLKEIEEPFEASQIGSSAMAYKRNPMRSERMAALGRYVIADMQNTAMTASSQWFERTLDDSANKRISVPEAFLAIDAVLNLYINISSGLVVYPKIIERHILAELPFMATENIMMEEVKLGGDRQKLHEAIRLHSIKAAQRIKNEGSENDLLQRLASDTMFTSDIKKLKHILNPQNFIGRAAEQVEELLKEIEPLLSSNDHIDIEEPKV